MTGKATMAEQLFLDLPARRALGREDFVLSEANAAAVAQIDASDRWPSGKLVLSGPEASGKTHLAHVWAARVDGLVVDATALSRLSVPTLAEARHVVVEDVPLIGGSRKEEAALFHLHNLLLSQKGRLLMTGRAAPSRWAIALPDLRSRILGSNLATLLPPDDALLAALLRKQFADRHIAERDGKRQVENVIEFLVPRMTRTGAEARRLVARIDGLSLSRKRPVTRELARRVLEDDPDIPGSDEDLT